MKVKLLKKLRKRAYKEIGVLYFVDARGCDTYNVGVREQLTLTYACSANVARSLDEAKRVLAWYRREMILLWVADKWAKRCQERLMEKNKEIVKL